MALAVLAYPVISQPDYQTIQAFRARHDALYYDVAEPHIPFVFPLEGIDRMTFTEETKRLIRGVRPIDIELKCATINKDAFIDTYHVLLVPDRGFSAIVRLHDKLYSNLFFAYLQMDIDFIPHIGIANAEDKHLVKHWVDQWNATDFNIAGRIETLTIVDYSNGVLTDLLELKLG